MSSKTDKNKTEHRHQTDLADQTDDKNVRSAGDNSGNSSGSDPGPDPNSARDQSRKDQNNRREDELTDEEFDETNYGGFSANDVEDEVKGMEYSSEDDTETENLSEEETDSKDDIIRKLIDQLDQKNDQLLRKAAEFENMRKRVQNERIRLFEDSRIDALLQFLPVNDDLQRTVNALREAGLEETWLKGIELVAGKMENILNQYGINKIDETGVPFNVELHDALMKQKPEGEDVPSDTVLQILEPGYKIGERVIRHAKVIVSE